jgi:group I intron endonuclease
MEKISGVYKITNKITGEFYIGSSKDIYLRWLQHKRLSVWKQQPNNRLYLDFQSCGLENFKFEIVEETDNLREREQYFIGLLKPAYNNANASRLNIERYKNYQKEYKGQHKSYFSTYQREYQRRLCLYNDETLTLAALMQRFRKANIPNPTAEARKYLIEQ